MKVILIKSWTNVFGRKYPVGQVMTVFKTLGHELLKKKYAKEYEGPKVKKMDTQSKVKSDFFKPKD